MCFGHDVQKLRHKIYQEPQKPRFQLFPTPRCASTSLKLHMSYKGHGPTLTFRVLKKMSATHFNFASLTQISLMDDFTQNHMRKGNLTNVV